MMRLCPLILLFLLGCGAKDAALSGAVTLDGQPLKDGYVTFFPPEGSTAAAVGAKVTDGRYELPAAPPGDRRAVVSATPRVAVQQSGDGPALLRFPPGGQTISAGTQGNNRPVALRRGAQTLDFALKNAPR